MASSLASLSVRSVEDDVALDYLSLYRAEKAALRKKLKEDKEKLAIHAKSDNKLSSVGSKTFFQDELSEGPGGTDLSASSEIPPLNLNFKRVDDIIKYKITSVPDLYYVPRVCDEASCQEIIRAINKGQFIELSPASVCSASGEASLQNYKDYVKQKRLNPNIWMQVRNRKLQSWGRQVENETHNGEMLTPMDEACSSSEDRLPEYLDDLGKKLAINILSSIYLNQSTPTSRLEDLNGPSFSFDHVLINKYEDNGGILHHTDGPRYKPFVAILSLGGPTVMSFRLKLLPEEIGIKRNPDLFSVVLESGSLLIFTKDMYTSFLHGIAPGSNLDVIGQAGECVNLHLLTDRRYQNGDELLRGERISLTFRNICCDSSIATAAKDASIS